MAPGDVAETGVASGSLQREHVLEPLTPQWMPTSSRVGGRDSEENGSGSEGVVSCGKSVQ